VNKYWLDKVHLPMPNTYADMVTVANKLRPMGVSLLTHEGGNKYLWPIYFFMAYAQTTGNKANQHTFDTLSGKRKFTDPEVVQALTVLQNMAKDQLFTPDTLAIDFPGAGAEFLHGKAAMYFQWNGMIGPVNTAPKPQNMNLMITAPPRWVSNPAVVGQLPGASYPAPSIYAKSANKALALKLIDFMTSDSSAKQLCSSTANLVSSNRSVALSGYPQIPQLKAVLPRMFTYMDWTWPPEVTGVFQTGIQGIIAGQQTPMQVATLAQQTLDGLRSKGYTFLP
jgi:raffinose/stachyose/melibiose transport system substrate-binding protein